MKTSHEFEAGHDCAIEREAEELFAHLWRRFRLKPFPCYERPHKGQQRDMAARRQPEFQRPGLRHVRVELDLVAERVQFPRQIEDVKAPARGDRDPQRLGYCHIFPLRLPLSHSLRRERQRADLVSMFRELPHFVERERRPFNSDGRQNTWMLAASENKTDILSLHGK